MANPIGGIEISVLANIAGLVSDLGKAQQENARAAKAMQEQWKNTADNIKSGFEGIASALSVGFGAKELVELGFRAIETAEQIDKMAQSLGASTQTLQTMQYVATATGGNLEDATGAFVKLEKAAVGAASGGKQQVEAFRAIGISASEVAGLLDKPDKLIQVTTEHLAAMANGTGKTTVMMELMGRGAATNAKFVNELGANFAGATEQARKFGLVLSQEDNAALLKANESIDLLKAQMLGLGNQIGVGLEPAIVKITELFGDLIGSGAIQGFFHDLGTTIAEVIILGQHLATALEDIDAKLGGSQMPHVFDDILVGMQNDLDAWERMKGSFLEGWIDLQIGAEVAWNAIENAALGSINDMAVELAQFLEQTATGMAAIGNQGAAGVFHAAAEGVAEFANSLKPVTLDLGAYGAKLDAVAAGVDAGIAANHEWVAGLQGEAAALKETGETAEGAGKGLVHYNANAAAAKDTTRQLLADQEKLQAFLDSLQGKLGGPYEKAWSEYNAALSKASDMAAKFTKDGMDVAKVQQFIADATELATQRISEQIDADAKIASIVDSASAAYERQTYLLTLNATERKVEEEYTRLMTAADKELLTVMGPLTEAQQKQLAGLHDLAEQHVKTDEAIENSKRVNQEYARIYENGISSMADIFGQFFTGQIKSWHDLGQSIIGSVKQMIGQIIAEYLKLNVLGPIISSLFGGGGGGGGLVSAGLGMLGSSGGGASGAAAGGSDMFGTAQGGVSLFNAGKTMFGGFQSAYSNFMYGNGTGFGSNFMGSYENIAGNNVWSPSGFGTAAGIAGGAYAGYGEYQRSGSVVGAAAYGVGTYAAAAGLGSMAAGGGFAAGVGGAAGLSAIPVVGWIALAAMLVDMFSGGKLFGTKGTVQGGSSALNIDSTGANFTNGVSLKGQKALFGGAKWSWQDIPETEEQKAAALAYFNAVDHTMEQYATAVGGKTADLLTATFEQKFDKKGKPTGETVATIDGHKYDNLTQQQFDQTYLAANELQVLSQFDAKLNATVEQYRTSADQLVSIAAGLTNAQSYLKQGGDMLAIAGKDTLSQFVTLAQGMQGAGEAIGDTINRLIQAQAAYDQFTAQFKPATNYVDDFEGALSSINDQMLANIKQANALAVAAGAAGASEKDLANIHNYAAQQAAQALMALESSAQSLAFSMGLTVVGSLDQVNAEIAQLQGAANQGSSAIGGFSNAMQNAAQRATEAMSLLLGDLSPLNDQQKWQKALQGLRAGTVTAEQALEIARRLDATGSDYARDYAQVMALSRGAPNSGAPATGGGRGGTVANPERLSQLLEEQHKLQIAADFQNAQLLAQQVAEIASAKGEDVQQVLDDMGIQTSDLEKRLNMSGEQFKKYIADIQAKQDGNGENTKSLISKLQTTNDILSDIRDAVGGHSTHGSPDADTGASEPRGSGHSGHGTRAIDENTEAVNNLNRTLGRGPGNRSSRGDLVGMTLSRTR